MVRHYIQCLHVLIYWEDTRGRARDKYRRKLSDDKMGGIPRLGELGMEKCKHNAMIDSLDWRAL